MKMKIKMKHNAKSLAKLVLYMILGGLLGGLFSGLSNVLSIMDLIERLGQAFIEKSPEIFLAWTSITSLAIIGLYLLGKTQTQRSLEKEDDVTNDGLLELALILANISTVVAIAIFVISSKIIFYQGIKSIGIRVVVFLVYLILTTMITHFIIEFIKSYNPEKRGDSIDWNFSKEWLESSDEREKLEIYEAGYKAFQNIQFSVPFLLAFFGIYSMERGKGISSLVVICLIYLIGNLSYYLSSLKKHKKD